MILACLIVAAICFILALVPPTQSALNWVALGLFFWVLTLLISAYHGA